MLIRHRFSASEPYLTPDVEDILDARADFYVCKTDSGCVLHYRDVSGKRIEKAFDENFRRIPHSRHLPDEEIFCFRQVVSDSHTYHTYTTPRKGYTAIMFGKSGDMSSKVITFGVARSCSPCICAANSQILIQWVENGLIMQSESNDNGNSFSAPVSPGRSFEFARIRAPESAIRQGIDICAVCGEEISSQNMINNIRMNYNQPERNNKMNTANNYRNFDDTAFFMKKLSEIESDVAQIGSGLEKICGFLEKLTKFKNETNEYTYIQPLKDADRSSKENLSGNDIGEIDTENIKLFETMNVEDDAAISKEFIQE